jgi:hypothetical protein
MPQPGPKSQFQVIVNHVPGFVALFQAMPSESRITSRQSSAAEANSETSHISHQVFGPWQNILFALKTIAN